MSRRKRMLENLDQDIQEHIEAETRDNIDRGMPPEEARYAALRKFGNVTRFKEETREVWTFVWLQQLLQDVRFSLRTLRKNPGFALTAILILALGIAANVIVFGVLQALILRPLDVPHPDRVMTLEPTNKDRGVFFAFPEVRDVRDGNSVFSAVAADRPSSFGLEADGATRQVWGYEVSGQYFEVVGIRPFLGRLLEPADDDHPGAAEVAVLSWPAWKSLFNGDPDIVGRTVRINKHSYTVVGVTPQGFYGTEKFIQPDIFVPMANEAELEGLDWLESRHDGYVLSVVRLKDGITLAQAQADLKTIVAGIVRQYPKDEETLSVKLARPGLAGDFMGAPVRAFLIAVMALAGIVLLAACANLGSLFAARTADRAKEIAIRLAIGSSRWRILRQIITEAFVISILASACACEFAWIALTAIANWRPQTNGPVLLSVQPQPSLFLASFLIAIIAGAIFGVMPLRQIFKADPNDAIKGGNTQSAAGRRWALRDVLLAAQVALCCVTVTAAFVALRGLRKSLTMDMGFKPQNAVLTKFDLSLAGYTTDSAEHFQRQLLERAAQLPGVEAVGYANTTPLAMDQSTEVFFSRETTDFRRTNEAFVAPFYGVAAGYFKAAGTPLLEGRDVSFADTANTPAVAVVNQEFARQLFHSEHAVGQFFRNQSGNLVQIVGIAADGKYMFVSEQLQPTAFFPIEQKPDTNTTLVVRSSGDANAMAAAVRKLIRDLDPAVALQESSAWSSQLALQLFPAQAATVALGLFGAFGLLLSITGTFGLASYTVSKRLRELGIRIALGAQARQILSTALGRMLILLGSGAVVGIVLGMAASRLLSAIVFQASAQDPFVLAAVAVTMLLTGSLSVAGPVRRALHIDPARLLREQ
jgi:predicted permease